MNIDLNADMGESFGSWKMGDDVTLLDIVTSANIACGFHAGDPDVMMNTMKMAAEKNVGIGAHPGFHDILGFGRHRISLPRETLRNQVRYQVAAAQGMAKAAGTHVRHLKLHGALSNMASEDHVLARDLYDAALSVAPDMTIMILAATAQLEAVRELGCAHVHEIFADRAYNDDATLVDRRQPNAMIHDPSFAGERIVNMIKKGGIISVTGKIIPTPIDTVCLHGDGPEAVAIARAVRATLLANNIAVEKFAIS